MVARCVRGAASGTRFGQVAYSDQPFKGKAKKADLATHLKRGLNAEAAGNVKRITKVMYRESHRDQLLQVADVVAGAVAHAYEREDSAFSVLLTVREHP